MKAALACLSGLAVLTSCESAPVDARGAGPSTEVRSQQADGAIDSREPIVREPAARSPATTDAHGDPLPAGAVARLGTERFRVGFALDLAMSRDGRFVAASDLYGTVRVWLTHTGETGFRFDCRADRLAFSRDGDRLAMVTPEGIIVHDLSTDARVLCCRFDRKGQIAAFSPDLERVLIVEDKRIRLLRLRDAKVLWSRSSDVRIDSHYDIHFSPDGSRVAVGLTDRGGVDVLDAVDGKRICSAAIGGAFRWMQGGDQLIGDAHPVRQAQYEIGVWSAVDGKRLRTVDVPGTFRTASADGSMVVTQDFKELANQLDDPMMLCRPGGRAKKVTLENGPWGSCRIPPHIAVSDDGKILAAIGLR